MVVATVENPLLIDIWQLAKGDYISPEFLEQMTGYQRDTKDYNFAVMTLREDLERRLGRIGNPITIKQEDAGLRLLTDSEAADYNARMGENFFHRMGRSHERNLTVDSNNLSTEEDQQHFRNLQVQGTMLSAARKARRDTQRKLRPKPVCRKTPGLPTSI